MFLVFPSSFRSPHIPPIRILVAGDVGTTYKREHKQGTGSFSFSLTQRHYLHVLWPSHASVRLRKFSVHSDQEFLCFSYSLRLAIRYVLYRPKYHTSSRGIKVAAPPLDSPCDGPVTYPGDTKILVISSKGRNGPTGRPRKRWRDQRHHEDQ